MANDLNQCNFIGRLGSAPETRYTTSGDCLTTFDIACGWKSKDKEGADWIRIVSFGKLAEICGQHLQKGMQVFISGRLKIEKFTNKDGIEQYATKVIADRMQMLGSAKAGEEPEKKIGGSRPAPKKDLDPNDDIPF